MMQGTPGVGRGMTIDYGDDEQVPSSQCASSRSVASPPNQKTRSTLTSSDMANMKVTANMRPDFTGNEQCQIRSNAMESPASLFQEVQRRQMLLEFQKQIQQCDAAGRPPLNQFDSSPRQRQPSLPPMDGEKQWHVSFDFDRQHHHQQHHHHHQHHHQQNQQQQMKQQQPDVPLHVHVPSMTMAAPPNKRQPMQQKAHLSSPAVSPQKQHNQQVQILQRSSRPTQSIQPPYQQGHYPRQQMQQQQQLSPPLPLRDLQQQRQDQTRHPVHQQQTFPSAFTSPFLPQNVSPPLLPVDPLSMLPIDTSKPPPPIGVPLQSLPFSLPGPPLVHFSPPNATTWPSLRQQSVLQPPLPPQLQVHTPPNPKPTPSYRHYPEKSKATSHMGGDSSAFTTVPDSVWDNFPLGGGYTPLDGSTKTSPQAFLSRASDLLLQAASQESPVKTDLHKSKGSIKQKRDGVQPQKPWARKDKAKGRGITKKDGQGAGVSPACKPGGAYSAPNPTKQPQETPQALSQEQAKNEYEWQSFKIVRKVRKVLGGLKNEQDVSKTAAEINKIMKAESGRLACFPWPKEQFVALDEILGWAMERPEIVEIVCQLIQELHSQHPESFAEDLTNSVMKRHRQYVKVSTATNKEKMYATFSGLVAHMFVLSRPLKSDFGENVDKLVDMIVNKWIMCDVQGTAEEPSVLAEVYTFCLRAFFIIIGPQLDEEKDHQYNKLLRDQVLGNQPRCAKEGLLDLLLLRAVGWKGSLEFKTESMLESKRETADDPDSRPETSESRSTADCDKVPENSPQDDQTGIIRNAEGSNSVSGEGDASTCVPSGAPAKDVNATAATEGPSQSVTSDVLSLDKCKKHSPSFASDVAVAVPPMNSSSLGQNAGECPDASAADAKERHTFNLDGDSTAKFKLPDKETAERGAFFLTQIPSQVPCIPTLPIGNSFMAPLQTTPQEFAPGVPTASLNIWSPVYINRPRETKTSGQKGSSSRHKLAKAGQPVHTDAFKGAETPQDSQFETANEAPNGSVGNLCALPSQTKPIKTTFGPANKSPCRVNVTGLAAVDSTEQYGTMDTKPKTEGPMSNQLSANNNNCLGESCNSDGQENDAVDHDSRLQSGKDEHLQPNKRKTSTGHTGLPRRRENFWEESSDSTSDLEQQPAASLGDYGPPQVFTPQQELSHQLGDNKIGMGQPTSSHLYSQRAQIQEPFHRHMEKGTSSLLAVAAGSPRCGSTCNVLGRGMMRLDQDGQRLSPATCLMTSPLAFIQATAAPTRSASKKDGDHQAAVEQTRIAAEAQKSQAGGSLNSGLGQTQIMEALQRNDDIEAPQTLSGDSNALSKVTVQGLSPRPDGSNIRDILQPTLDVATDYFGEKGSQNGQHIQDIFKKTAVRAPEFVAEETDKTLDERESPTLEDNPDDDLGKESQEAINKEVAEKKVPGVTAQTSPPECEEEQLLGTGSQSSEPAKQSTKCLLCGSDKHQTRQCDEFKMYAPQAKTSDREPEPEQEPEIPEIPKMESRFGQTIFCSKCGQKGHLTYDCQVLGNFNLFK